MKELDVLLEHFVQAHHEALARNAWPELEDLLQTEDDQLWDWLQNPDAAPAACYRDLLIRIRNGTGSAH